MTEITEINLKNFKAFYGFKNIEVYSKHLLLYGENGSGKSSIYWALYTLLQSSTKDNDEIAKYFIPNNSEHLINYHFLAENKGKSIQKEDSFIEIKFDNNKKLRIDTNGKNSTEEDFLYAINRHSDFISHRMLTNFYNFRNSKQINLWEVFVRDIFPFLLDNSGNGNKTLSQKLQFLENNMPYRRKSNDFFEVTKSVKWKKSFKVEIQKFNDDINYWLSEINIKVSEYYNTKLKNENDSRLRISLIYDTKLSFSKGGFQKYKKDGKVYKRWNSLAGFNDPTILLKIEINNEEDEFEPIYKPQSFFNEARLTNIALAIRFTLLSEFVRPEQEGQFLVLDDLLISLDMANRDKVIDIILKEFAPKYKIYLFTHERAFYDFCVFKIKQNKQQNDWKFKEIHSAKNKKETPILIDSGLSFFELAEKYFNTKDYTASSLYLRKDLEKLIADRLPELFKKTVDGHYNDLTHYWKLFVERFSALGKPIPKELKELFEQSKLLILNPQAHYSLGMYVYENELLKAFHLVKELHKLPIPSQKLLIDKGTRITFIHPNKDYSLEFVFKNDFFIHTLETKKIISVPKCEILTWSFNGVEHWDLNKKKKIYIKKNIEDKFHKMVNRHVEILPLDLTNDLFIDNLMLPKRSWTFKKVLDLSNVKFENGEFRFK